MDPSSLEHTGSGKWQQLLQSAGSEAVVAGHPAATASSMALASSASNKRGLPSVLLPKPKVAEKTLEEASALLTISIAKQPLPQGHLPFQRTNIVLFDKDNVSVLTRKEIDINLFYSLSTLVLQLQKILDDACAKGRVRHLKALLVKAIKITYFNKERHVGLPAIVAVCEHAAHAGTAVESVHWKEDMLSYWEKFKPVLFIGGEAQIFLPLLNVRTIERAEIKPRPHYLNPAGNGHIFGNRLSLEDSSTDALSTDQANIQEETHEAASEPHLDQSQTTLEQSRSTTQKDAIFASDSQDIDTFVPNVSTKQLEFEVDTLVAYTEVELEKFPITRPVKKSRFQFFFKHIEVAVDETSNVELNATDSLVPVALNDSVSTNGLSDDELLHGKAQSWSDYQQMGGDIWVHKLYDLGQIPFPLPIPYEEGCDGESFEKPSSEMVPYINVNFSMIYPDLYDMIQGYRERVELAISVHPEDDATFIPGLPASPTLEIPKPTDTLKYNTHQETQNELNRILRCAMERRGSRRPTALHLEALSTDGSHAPSSEFSAPRGQRTTSGLQSTSTILSARSTPFIPSMNNMILPTPAENLPSISFSDSDMATSTHAMAYSNCIDQNMYNLDIQGLDSPFTYSNTQYPGTSQQTIEAERFWDDRTFTHYGHSTHVTAPYTQQQGAASLNPYWNNQNMFVHGNTNRYRFNNQGWSRYENANNNACNHQAFNVYGSRNYHANCREAGSSWTDGTLRWQGASHMKQSSRNIAAQDHSSYGNYPVVARRTITPPAPGRGFVKGVTDPSTTSGFRQTQPNNMASRISAGNNLPRCYSIDLNSTLGTAFNGSQNSNSKVDEDPRTPPKQQIGKKACYTPRNRNAKKASAKKKKSCTPAKIITLLGKSPALPDCSGITETPRTGPEVQLPAAVDEHSTPSTSTANTTTSANLRGPILPGTPASWMRSASAGPSRRAAPLTSAVATVGSASDDELSDQ